MATREAELDELMARLANGDRSAFEPLYAALRPRALRVASPDVAQAALLKVFANASEFEAGRPCLPWFYAVVANELRAARRREARDIPMPIADDALVHDDNGEKALAARELERALELAIDALDPDSANAINSLLGRAPLPDIAAPTFRKRVSRAYAKLRVLLGGHDAS